MKILPIALTAAGAYVAYKMGLFNSLFGSTPATTSTTGGGGSTGTGVNNPTNPSPGTLDTRGLVAQRAGNPNSMTFDQWNYIYALVRGVPGPDPAMYLSADQRARQLTINEWWSYMQQAGMNGLGITARVPRPGLSGYARLNTIPPRNNMQPPPTDTQPGMLPPGGVGMCGYMGLGRVPYWG